MGEKLDPKELVTPEELALSNMWEIAAVVELLERKGLCTKQDLYDIIEELRARHPAALKGKVLFPEAKDLTKLEHVLVDRVRELISAVGLRPTQAKALLSRVCTLLEQEAQGEKDDH